jgi:hypothetical protein
MHITSSTAAVLLRAQRFRAQQTATLCGEFLTTSHAVRRGRSMFSLEFCFST